MIEGGERDWRSRSSGMQCATIVAPRMRSTGGVSVSGSNHRMASSIVTLPTSLLVGS